MIVAVPERCPQRRRPTRRRPPALPGRNPNGSTDPRVVRRSRACLAGLAGLLLLAWMPAVPAQEPPAQPSPAAPQPPQPPGETIPSGSVLRLLGRDVTGPDGQVVAQVVNLLVDAAGQPQAAILDYGGFLGLGKRRIAVVWRALRFAPEKQAGAITLALGPDQLKSFPEFKPDGPLLAAAPPDPAPRPDPAQRPDPAAGPDAAPD